MDVVSLLVACGAFGLGVLGGRTWRRKPAKRRSEPDRALRRARALLNALPDTWLVIGGHGELLELHFVPRPGSDAPVPKLRGQSMEDFFSERVVEKLKEARERCLREPSEVTFEFDMHVRGEARAAQARVLPLIDDEVVVVIKDVSERKMLERALSETRSMAESMLNARTEAFARLSHDVRNQMTGVLTITDMLLAREAGPHARRYLETIQRCGDNIVELVNNMIDLSRLERGSLIMRASRVDVQGLVGECVEVARSIAPAQTRVEYAIEPDAPREVLIDGGRLRQVLMNLLHNAVKFTPEGTIHVRLGAEGNDTFTLEVRDTGQGIPETSLPHIFDAYFQAHEERAEDQRKAGSGLGLAIVQSLTRAMGGEVKVESVEGEGTTFLVSLPRRPLDSVEQASDAHKSQVAPAP